MKTKEITEMQRMCQVLLVGKLLDYVRLHGREVTDYDRNEFGLEDSKDSRVTRVLNLFDNGGCCFTLQHGSVFTTYAVHCLYVEEYRGTEYLMSYSLYNEGTEYDEDESEPDHESMLNESLAYVSRIADAVIINF